MNDPATLLRARCWIAEYAVIAGLAAGECEHDIAARRAVSHLLGAGEAAEAALHGAQGRRRGGGLNR